MTQLQKWIEINQLYDQSSPGWIRFKLALNRNFFSTMFYSLYIVSPPIIGLLILSATNFYLWMLLIYIIYLQLLIFFNDRMLYPSFKTNELMDLPISKRAKYLHYLRFKDLCDHSDFAKDKVQKLLHWHKASDTKMYTYKFISSTKLALAIAISLSLYYYQPQLSGQLSSNKFLGLQLMTALVYIIIYLLDDFGSIYKRREHKLCTFLYMYVKEEGD